MSSTSSERESQLFQYEVLLDALTRIEMRFKLLLDKEVYCVSELEYVEAETQSVMEKLTTENNAVGEQIKNIKLRISLLRSLLGNDKDPMHMLSLLEDVIKTQFRKAQIEKQGAEGELTDRINVLEEAVEKMRTEKWNLTTENYKLKQQLDNKKDEVCKTKELVKTIRLERDEMLSHLERIPKCSICLEKQPELLYLPCSHFICCDSCGKNLAQCPMCRQDVWRKITVFQ